MSDKAIIGAAARALLAAQEDWTLKRAAKWLASNDDEMARCTKEASAVLAAVTPLIRAEALEEAAVVAEDEDGEFWYAGEHRNMAMLQQCCREIAAAIRTLKTVDKSDQ